MQFTMRDKSPQQFLFSSVLAGVSTAAIAPVILLSWCLRTPLLSIGFVFRVVGGCVLSIWWSAALYLITHGNADAGRQIRTVTGPAEKQLPPA